jgi:hypothetical protein
MGIGFVLIAWAIIGTISAVLGGLTLGGVTAFFTRGVRKHPTDSIVVACVFPFFTLPIVGASSGVFQVVYMVD